MRINASWRTPPPAAFGPGAGSGPVVRAPPGAAPGPTSVPGTVPGLAPSAATPTGLSDRHRYSRDRMNVPWSVPGSGAARPTSGGVFSVDVPGPVAAPGGVTAAGGAAAGAGVGVGAGPAGT